MNQTPTLYDRGYMVANLCFLYSIIRASEPLLEMAIRRSDGELRDYYLRHLGEEQKHDEILLDDLMRIGVMPMPYHAAAQIAGAQYYLLAHDEPESLLGYMLALESFPLSVEEVENIEKHHGFRLDCARVHAENDPAHSAALREQIEKLPQDKRDKVMWNMQCTLSALNVAFGELWKNTRPQPCKQ